MRNTREMKFYHNYIDILNESYESFVMARKIYLIIFNMIEKFIYFIIFRRREKFPEGYQEN